MRQSKIAGEQLSAINAEKDRQAQAREEYEKLLKNLDSKVRDVLKQHLSRIEFLISDGDFGENDRRELMKIGEQLTSDLRSITRGSAVLAVDFSKKEKAAEFAPYIAELQRLLSARNVPTAEIAKIIELPRLVPVFGGGLDKKILDGVWNKAWPDSLNVDDRIKRISAHSLRESERIIKEGINLGKSASDISKDLRGHFETAGLERKAAFRLAAHTTNMTYQAAQAEISVQANFVMGIRIVRAIDGSETCDICAEHGGEVGGPGKEYFKDDFGGSNADLYVMTNSPAYHSYCKCELETIYETAEQFVRNAMSGASERSYKAGWE